MVVALIAFMLLQPIGGVLSDRIGIKNNMLLFTGLATLLTTPLLMTLSTATSAYVAFFLVLCGFLIASFYTPIAGIVKAELFPAEVRALGVGFPYAIAIRRNSRIHCTMVEIAERRQLLFLLCDGDCCRFTYCSAERPDLRTKGTGEIEK
jgi:hypothetical protein